MSQSETLMLIALGFAIAIILVLLVGRTFWNLAVHLGARRHEKQLPRAMLELQADRDRLRAEHAMMSRKLELRLDDIKARMTEQMAEVSRNRNRVQSMLQELERRDEIIRIRDREVEALNAQLEVHRADLANGVSAIEELRDKIAAKDLELVKQANIVVQLSAAVHERNAATGGMGEEPQSDLRVAASEPASRQIADSGEDRLRQRIAKLTSLSSEMISQRENPPFADVNNIALSPIPLPLSTGQDLPITPSPLEEKTLAAERESAAMSDELEALDQLLATNINPPLTAAEATTEPRKSGAMANVISLAQRIRALQHAMYD
jgi:hypothetical protein